VEGKIKERFTSTLLPWAGRGKDPASGRKEIPRQQKECRGGTAAEEK